MSETKTVIVWAGLKVKEGFVQEFKDIAKPVVESTRREAGCIKYDLLQDCDNSTVFYFFEEYVDDAAFEAHRNMPYMHDFRPKREKCLDHFLGVRVMSENYNR